MRIAHVTDCYLPRVGGIELHVRDLASRQLAAGHSATVVTSVPDGKASEASDGIVVVRPPSTSRRHPSTIQYRRSWSGREHVLSGKYDVIHVHASSFSPLAFLTAVAASRAGIPTAVTVHSLWSSATPLFAAADRLVRWGDLPIAWSAVSTIAAQPLRRVLRGRTNVDVIPNGIEATQWTAAADVARSGSVRVIAVTRLARRKRPVQLLAMLREAAREIGQDGRLSAEIIGDGPQRRVVERYLQRHRMTGWVRLAGWRSREQIRAAHARADIFVAPARLESFGIAALEARCAGLPVVARSGTGIEEFVVHRRGGILVGSDADMVAAIIELVRTPALRRQMRAHNLSHVPAASWETVLNRCEALYESAAAVQASRGRHPWPSASR